MLRFLRTLMSVSSIAVAAFLLRTALWGPFDVEILGIRF